MLVGDEEDWSSLVLIYSGVIAVSCYEGVMLLLQSQQMLLSSQNVCLVLVCVAEESCYNELLHEASYLTLLVFCWWLFVRCFSRQPFYGSSISLQLEESLLSRGIQQCCC